MKIHISKLSVLLLPSFLLCVTGRYIEDTDDTNLELAFVIFRHGERTPETNELFPSDEYSIKDFFPMTYGELTKEGKRRQYELGKKLRRKYNDFLGPYYNSNNVITYSTNWDRTKTSALLTLAGLFPPDPSQIWDPELKWLPIPYHYRTSEHDHLLQRPDPYCPRYVKELEEVIESEEVLNIALKYKKVFDYVTEKTGRDMFDFHEMFRIYQNLHGKQSLNLTIPEWARSIYPEPLQTIASYQCIFENYNPLLRRLNGGHILGEFIELSKQKIDGTLEPKERKLFLYSGHENNIVNILAVLELFDQHIPPYCSTVMFELHKSKFTDEYGFKIFYDNNTYSDEVLSLDIPNCGSFCPFDSFVSLTKTAVPVNYTAECESNVYLD